MFIVGSIIWCWLQVSVLIIVPPIAVDLTCRRSIIDRAAFSSVHTAIVSAATLSPNVQRQLQHRTGIRRVQQGENHTRAYTFTRMHPRAC